MKINRRVALLMKAGVFIWFLGTNPTFAMQSYAQAHSVTIRLSNSNTKQILKEIERQTDYLFVYNETEIDLNRRVKVDTKKQSVNTVLDQLFNGTPITYVIEGNNILLTSRKTANQRTQKRNSTQQNSNETRTIHGVVSDEKGEPIIGASVQENGTNRATVTDLDGRFSLKVAYNATLTVSYIGYSSQQMKVGQRKTLDIMLREDAKVIDELVVVGYGKQKKLTMTGAVAAVSGDVLNNRPIGNIAQGLQGVVPNLNITFNSGQPSAGAGINIRGNTSLNGGSALVLIDGVEGDISMLNPQDVESVSVLKDASSAAIYGARAAFGVMLITTKQGKANQKVKVSYSNNLAWSKPARLPKMPRADVWARAWNDAYDSEQPGDYYFTDRFLEALDAHIADPEHNPAILVDTEGIQSPNYTPNKPGWAYVGNTDWIDRKSVV